MAVALLLGGSKVLRFAEDKPLECVRYGTIGQVPQERQPTPTIQCFATETIQVNTHQNRTVGADTAQMSFSQH